MTYIPGNAGQDGLDGSSGTAGSSGSTGAQGNPGSSGTSGLDPIVRDYAITSSGGAYYVDGVIRDTLTLLKGFTYKFDQSDSSNAGAGGHPLAFSTTSNGTWGGGTKYTSGFSYVGTVGTAGAYALFKVPHNAPDTLYYYCENHSGMGASANINTLQSGTSGSSGSSGAGGGGGGASNINDLGDVSITSAQNKQVLRYDGSGWVNATHNVNDLGDVSISNLQTNQILKYNGTTWVNDADSTGGGGGGASNINDLGDVSISSAQNNEILRYNGSNWVNSTESAAGALGELSDVNHTSGAAGNVLIRNTAGTFANKPISVLGDDVAWTEGLRLLVGANIYRVTGASSGSGYAFSDLLDSGNDTSNPRLYLWQEHTYAFYLSYNGASHPFAIRTGPFESNGTPTHGTNLTSSNGGNGLFHIDTDGSVTDGTSANGQYRGWLVWRVPMMSGRLKTTDSTSPHYGYQCTVHAGMYGEIFTGHVWQGYNGGW